MAEITSRIMTLPVLALRGVSVFPGTILHFDVERPMSIAALNAAIGTDRLIFLVPQKDITCNTPTPQDLYSVGTICRLSQILRGNNGMVKCIVDGVHRARLLRVTADTPSFWGNVQVLSDLPADDASAHAAALIRHCSDLFAEYAATSGSIGPEVLLKIADRTDPSFVSDYIAQHVYFRPADKQKLLEELDPMKRLAEISELLKRELDILDIQNDIQATASERMNKNQKDYYLREQMKAIREELGEDDEDDIEDYRDKICALHLPEDSEKKLLKEVNHLAKQPFGSQEGAVIRTYLDICLELPWNQKTTDNFDIVRAKKILDDDHYGLSKVKERILEYLAVRSLTDKAHGTVLCLVGPPGVGKTSIAMSVARAMGRKTARLSLGGVHDEAEIRGHRKTYIGAMPGRIIEGIRQAGTANPVLVLDEIDKLGSDYRGDPSSALLEVLDGEQNAAFRDHFLEIPFDLSDVFFITTANKSDTIPRALLDRMEIIELGSYTDEEKREIAKRHLLPKQREKHGINGNQLRVSDDAIREIIARYTRESGVRQLERELAAICRKAAKGIAEGGFRALRLRAGELEPYLGAAKYKPEQLFSQNGVGLVHGLAWTSVGGEVLDVECAVVPGTGKLELTGNLGDVMKESCHAAVTYIRSRSAALGVDPEFYKNTDIHLHFPEGAIPKDGPSAGAAICLCVVSALTGRAVRRDIAMTGEITLRGRVLAIGGIQEKTMGALRAGIHEILLPEDNVPDLAEIDPLVRNAVNYTAVSNMDQVLEKALCPAEGKREDPILEELPVPAPVRERASTVIRQ